MSFSPYHQFQNKSRLERVVSDFHTGGNLSQELFDNFYRYHRSMIYKLQATKHNIDRLYEKLTTTDIQDAANSDSNFLFEINMFIDGFFYNSGSSLDILARIILALFGQPLTGIIYFESAFNTLNRVRSGDSILPRIQRPPWRESFSNYRNTLTHELILAPRFRIEIDTIGENTISKIVIPLPDDPRSQLADRSYRRNPDVFAYVEYHFRRILSITNVVYGEIATRATAQGSLPL